MSSKPLPLIPTPLSERLRELRQRILPVIIFVSAIALIAVLWKEHVVIPTMMGQAEPVMANVTSPQAGVLSEIKVSRFQSVKAGDVIGKVFDPHLGSDLDPNPIILRAPIDGAADEINVQNGEAIAAGKPIVKIVASKPMRIVGYLRSPVSVEPKVGMKVEVRTRGLQRATALAEVCEVGTQFETIPAPLASPIKLVNIELGLPVQINIPKNLSIRPGELVEISILPAKN